MKTIVTHISPDLDACSSVWLIKRFLPKWSTAQVVFVNAGSTFEHNPPDLDSDIIHVDTGLGKFDHHQCPEQTSAARKVFNYLQDIREFKEKDREALDRMVDFITLVDNFGEVYFPESSADIYDFLLQHIIDGLKAYHQNDQRVLEMTLGLLDAVHISLKNKIHAEKEILQGRLFNTKWGKGIALETKNDEVMAVALKNNYAVVVRKDPSQGYIRIKSFPGEDRDLEEAYKVIRERDTKGTWFLHASKHILLNGSSKNKDSMPSSLSLTNIIEILMKI